MSPENRRDSLTDKASNYTMEPVNAGRVRLIIHKGKGLEKKDVTGKSDPYVVIQYEGNKVGETKVCKKNLEPVWEEDFSINITEDGQEMIELAVFDKDKVGKDERMGTVSIDVRRVCKLGALSQVWSNLQNCKSGSLQWSAEWEEDELEEIRDPVVIPPEEPLDQITPELKPDFSETSEKVEEENIELDRPSEVTEQKVQKIIDREPEVTEDMTDVEPEKTESLGTVRAGFLRVTVHKARDLIAKDIGGGSDPYVVIKYDGQKSKSKHVENDLNPELEFTTGYVTEDDGPSELVIELKDHDFGKDESLGSCSFDLRRVMSGSSLQQVWTELVGVRTGEVLVSIQFTGSGYNDGPEANIVTMEEPSNISTEESGLRQRNVASRGRVRLNILYDTNKEELKVFLHEAQGLPGRDLPDPPDPQVKVYLMPGKKKKKKSHVVKDCVDPTFNEEFDFNVDFKDLPHHWLKVTRKVNPLDVF